MNKNPKLILACVALTMFCGVAAIAIAIFGPTADPSPLLASLQNVLVTTFGLGVTAFLFKALGG